MKGYKLMFLISVIEIFLMTAVFLTACNTPQPLGSPETMPVAVTRSIMETIVPTMVWECTPFSTDMTLDIQPLSQQSVKLMMTGLQPGEEILLQFDREGVSTDGLSDLVIEQLSVPVNDEGYVETTQSGLEAREDGLSRWQIKVIHTQGVTCTEITLP